MTNPKSPPPLSTTESQDIEEVQQNRIFLSYSRTEMYHAEAIALSLQHAGLNIWFDLQQLEPGCIWLDEITRGLQHANQLVVIVSKTALASPWVYKEWQHAIDTQVPIHLILFEEVNFGTHNFIDENGEEITIDTSTLLDHANSIIDGRTNFNTTVDRLILALQGDYTEKIDIPAPNPFGIPTRLPPAVGFVGVIMGALVAFLLWLTIQSVSIFLPVTVAGFVLVALSAYELYNFLTRQSFRGTRFSLLIAFLFALLLFPPLALVFLLGWLVSIFSLDVNRWSPRGEGSRRGEMSNWLLIRKMMHASTGIYRWYESKRFVFKILVLFLFAGLNFIFGVAIESSLLSSRLSDTDTIIIFLPLIFFTLVTIATWVLPLLRRNEKNKNIPPSGKTFRVIYSLDNATVAEAVAETMMSVGHQRTIKNNDEVDYNVLIASNQLRFDTFKHYLEQEGRWIVLVVSNLEQRDWFEQLQDFQWVDFRKQDQQQLELMVDELRDTQFDIVSHSFSTRTTPQSFSKMILPRSVQLYVLLQILTLNIGLAVTLGIISRVTEWNAILIATITLQLISSLISIAVTVRVMYQDITVDNIVNINVFVGIAGYIVGLVVGLSQPLPPGYSLDGNAVLMNIILNMIGFAIGYYIARNMLNSWLGRWLPTLSKSNSIFAILWNRYRPLYVRSFAIVGIVLLLLLSLFSVNPNPDSDSRRNRLTSPISVLLRSANSPVSDGLADFIDTLVNT